MSGGTIVDLQGLNFIDSVFYVKFGNVSSSKNVFSNSTLIQITSPASNSSQNYLPIYYSINGGQYYNEILINNTGINFLYYNEIVINSISPKTALYDESVDIMINATNVINSSLLRCKANTLIIKPTIQIIKNKQYIICSIPSINVVDPNFSELQNIIYNVSISLSNNNQQYSTPVNFNYIIYQDAQIKNFIYSPRNGPSTGQTNVTISAINLINPLIYSSDYINYFIFQFGDFNSTGKVYSSNTIYCLSPSINQISTFVEYNRDLNYAVVNLNVYMGRKIFNLLYKYDLNVTLTGLSPNNVELNKSLNINVYGTGFFNYSSSACIFNISDGTSIVIVKAKFVDFNLIQCSCPSYPIQATAKLSISLNNQDIYSINNNLLFYFRPCEIITNVSPINIPLLGETVLSLTFTYLFNFTNNNNAFCLITDKTSLINYKTRLIPSSDSNSGQCIIPNALQVRISFI